MRKTTKSPSEKIVKDIKRATRRHYSSEEKIRIVLDGLRGEDSIAELCRREGISQVNLRSNVFKGGQFGRPFRCADGSFVLCG